jgi:hypothetical protein
MPKRLRGESTTSVQSLQGENSNLVTKLLMLAFSGKISHSACQEIALAAIMDGASHPELAKLASAGSHGVHPGNVKRDVLTNWLAHVKIAEPDVVKVPCINPKTNESIMSPCSLFLPHKLISSLASYEHFDAIFQTSQIDGFWKSVKDEDPRLQALLAETGWSRSDLKNTIPLFLHGDGVEYTCNDSLEVCNFGPLLGHGESTSCAFLCFAYPKSITIENKTTKQGTMTVLTKKVLNSFKACMKGTFPVLDDDGNPWAVGSKEKQMAGKPLTPRGHKFVVWALTGDHEHYANWLKLPHWSCHRFCWSCDANKTDANKTGYDFSPGKLNMLKLRSVKEELEKRISEHNFFKIPGVTSFSVMHDALHVIFCNGVLSHLFGSFLHTLCFSNKGHQKLPPEHRLSVVFQRIQEIYKSQSADSRINNLQIGMFCDRAKPHADFPCLKSKAAETKHLLPVLTQLSQETMDPHEPMHEHRHKAFTAINRFCELIDESPPVPTTEQARHAEQMVSLFLTEYKWLCDWAKTRHLKLFPLKPKFHMLWHMSKDFKFLNPKVTWTFKNEDYVGKISHLAHSCSYGISRPQVNSPMCSQYRCLMHLKLERCFLSDDI